MDRARFEHAAVLLAKSLTNEMLDSLRQEWGNTNHDVLRHWRNEVLEAVASPVAVEPQQQEEPRRQALDALEFAHGAIVDAIGLEDGLDGLAGEGVLRIIRNALSVNGRPLPWLPSEGAGSQLDAVLPVPALAPARAQEGHKPAPLVDCPTCAGSQYIRVDGQVEDCPNPNCYQGFVR